MTRDSPDPFQDGNTTSPLIAEETALESSKHSLHSPSLPINMMAVLPAGASHGSSLHDAARRTSTSVNAVAATRSTHDSTGMRTISTAASTESKNVQSFSLTHFSNHVETTTTASSANEKSVDSSSSADPHCDQFHHTLETTVEESKTTSQKSTIESEQKATETKTTMCKASPTFSATSETTPTKELQPAASLDQVMGNNTTTMAASHEEEHDDDESTSMDQDEDTKSTRKKRTLPLKPGQSQGRWTNEEHEAFLAGLKVYGREWKKVADQIPTRTSAQIRSHAQKYFAKLAREESMVLQDQTTFDDSVPTLQGSSSSPLDALPPSAQRNAERIMANPTSVQQEVENTLRALQARYRELQIQLQERTRARQSSRHNVRHLSDMERRKRNFTDLTSRQPPRPPQTSTTTVRELADQELIAVAVLGGALPRSASKQDLEEEQEEQNQPTANDNQDASNTENKRPRLSSDSDSDGDSMIV